VKLVYNAIAGTSAERLAALSDGVFAVFTRPCRKQFHSEKDL
jgi:hypothetical protein